MRGPLRCFVSLAERFVRDLLWAGIFGAKLWSPTVNGWCQTGEFCFLSAGLLPGGSASSLRSKCWDASSCPAPMAWSITTLLQVLWVRLGWPHLWVSCHKRLESFLVIHPALRGGSAHTAARWKFFNNIYIYIYLFVSSPSASPPGIDWWPQGILMCTLGGWPYAKWILPAAGTMYETLAWQHKGFLCVKASVCKSFSV